MNSPLLCVSILPLVMIFMMVIKTSSSKPRIIFLLKILIISEIIKNLLISAKKDFLNKGKLICSRNHDSISLSAIIQFTILGVWVRSFEVRISHHYQKESTCFLLLAAIIVVLSLSTSPDVGQKWKQVGWGCYQSNIKNGVMSCTTFTPNVLLKTKTSHA